MNSILRKTKLEFFSGLIKQHARDQKAIFRISNAWMGSTSKNIEPKGISHQQCANNFASFFANKAEQIHKTLEENLDPWNPYVSILAACDLPPIQLLTQFAPTTREEVEKLVSASNAKSCDLDPAPTEIVKKLIHILSQIITLIINKSFQSGTVPADMKKALVRPTLKEHWLDTEDAANYRPVSNLSFLSKIMEKVVDCRLDKHLNQNTLLSNHQSAYRKNHSTETTLVKVQNDILVALDQGYATLLILLDISAAFDVVDHERLLERHSQYFGIRDKALDWMSSYLEARSYCVVVGCEKSYSIDVKYGFPQGSVLGGKKFTMYSTPLGNIIVLQGVEHECYADDTQKYLRFKLKDEGALRSAISQMQKSLEQVQWWMSANMLKLNGGKTKMIIFAPEQHLEYLTKVNLLFDNTFIKPKNEVLNLGVMFDSSMSMKAQINSVTKNCYHQIRRISKIRRYLTEDATRSLVHAYVTSRLDYCNSLYSGLPMCLLNKLQRVQNSAARLVRRLPWRASITRQLNDLHWLPIIQRIKFKILLLVYKSQNNLAPHYIKTMFHRYEPLRNLRSRTKLFLTVKRHRTRYGARAVSNAGPALWNKIPINIKKAKTLVEFKALLKTYLFNDYYNSS